MSIERALLVTALYFIMGFFIMHAFNFKIIGMENGEGILTAFAVFHADLFVQWVMEILKYKVISIKPLNYKKENMKLVT